MSQVDDRNVPLGGHLTRRRLVQSALGAGGAALLTATPSIATSRGAAAQGEAQSGGTVAFADVRMPPTLDIQATLDDFADVIGQQIYQPLVYINPESAEPTAGLATSWQAGSDGRTWTFQLREGVTFHDGTPFTAAAVKRSWERLTGAEIEAPKADILGGENLVSIETPDDLTVVVTHQEPMANFLANIALTAAMIISPAAIDQFGAGLSDNPVGTGPFRLKEYVQADHVTLERWDDFNWAPDIFAHQGPAYLDEFTFFHITEDGTRVAALESGDLDIGRLPYSQYQRFEQEIDGYAVTAISNPGVPGGIYLNSGLAPLDDVKVRQAIAAAVEREPILNSPVFGPATWLELGPLTMDVWGYDPAVEQVWPAFDPAMAGQLLGEAGYQEGSDGIMEKDGERLTLRLIAASGNAPFSQIIQEQLRAVGIEVEITQLDPAARFTQWDEGNDHMFPSAHTGNDPDLLWAIYHSGGQGRVNDPRVDELLEQGRITLDPEQRRGIYSELQQHIAENAYSFHVYNSSRAYGLKESVQGISFNERSGIYAYDIWVTG